IDETFDDLPPLYLSVAYRDIQNKRYKKKLKVAFRFYSIASKSRPRPELSLVQNLDFGTLFTIIKEAN
ncbi:MAG TPA: hypothetical protein VJ552_04780, partial [Sediminibacterium sp.]|nr:hypothetical protein [Sediminibacterium sp.]